MKIPFGKYSGIEVCALPDDYIFWLSSLVDLRAPLRSAVQSEYRARFEDTSDERHSLRQLPAEVQKVASELIDTGYRGLAKKFHPDVGGSHEGMLLLVRAKEWLNRQIQGTTL